MAVQSPRRLGGPIPPRLGTITSPERDPRRSLRPGPTSPAKATATTSFPTLSSPIVSAPTPNDTTSRSTEAQTTPNHGDAPSISAFFTSALRLSKSEDEKARLEKEITSLTKGLQRATQFQQFSSTITSYQHQLERAKDELARHMKSIAQQRASLTQSEIDFNESLSKRQSQPQPHLDNEQLLLRLNKLESLLPGTESSPGVPASAVSVGEIQEIKTQMGKMEEKMSLVVQTSEGLKGDLQLMQQKSDVTPDMMALMTRIAASVDSCATEERTMGSQLPELERQLHAAVQSNQKQYVLCQERIETAEDSIKDSREKNEERITTLKNRFTTFETQSRDAFLDVNQKASNLSINAKALIDDNSENVNSSTDLETQRHQNSQQIAAQEQHLKQLETLLKTREHNGASSRTITTTPQAVSEPDLREKYRVLAATTTEHGKILDKIQEIHSNFQQTHLTRLETITKEISGLQSGQNTSSGKIDDMSRNYQNLVHSPNFKMAIKNECEAMKGQICTQLHTAITQETQKMVEPLLQLPDNVRKCENITNGLAHLPEDMKRFKTKAEQVDTLIQAVRSLETRYINITTGNLVHRMSQEMHKMYPSTEQLNETVRQQNQNLIGLKGQLTQVSQEGAAAHKQMAQKLSSREAELGTVKKEMAQLKEDLTTMQQSLDAAKAELEKSHSKEGSKLETHTSEEKRLSPEELKALVESEIGPLKSTIEHQGGQLGVMLQRASDMSNMVGTQKGCIEELSESLDELKGDHKDLFEMAQGINTKLPDVDSIMSTIQGSDERITDFALRIGNIKADMDEMKRSETAGLLLNGKCEQRLQKLEDLTSCIGKGDTKAKDDIPKIHKKLRELRVDMEDIVAKQDTHDGQLEQLQQAESVMRELGVDVEKMVAKQDTHAEQLEKLQKAESVDTHAKELEQLQKAEPVKAFMGRLRSVEDKVKAMEIDTPIDQSVGSRSSQQTKQRFIACNPATDKVASPRPVQDLKRRRRESTVPDSGRSTPNSPLVVSSSSVPDSATPSADDSSSPTKPHQEKQGENTQELDEKERAKLRADKKQRKEEKRQAKKAGKPIFGAKEAPTKKRKVG
ncbi:unnamed protein product [Penicillium bialowiezense]